MVVAGEEELEKGNRAIQSSVTGGYMMLYGSTGSRKVWFEGVVQRRLSWLRVGRR